MRSGQCNREAKGTSTTDEPKATAHTTWRYSTAPEHWESLRRPADTRRPPTLKDRGEERLLLPARRSMELVLPLWKTRKQNKTYQTTAFTHGQKAAPDWPWRRTKAPSPASCREACLGLEQGGRPQAEPCGLAEMKRQKLHFKEAEGGSFKSL